MWLGESPKDSFPKREGEICGFTFSFATGQEIHRLLNNLNSNKFKS